MKCIRCNSNNTRKDGSYKGLQRYKCLDCKRRFNYGIYENKIEYINHFNTKIRKTIHNKLTRENYCIPTNKISYVCRRSLKHYIDFHDYKVPNEYYIDENTYSDKFVREHYNKCIYNYDLNMKYFSSLVHSEFDKYLNSFVLKNRFEEIYDLKDVDKKRGIYILVLDEYNQVYIGMSEDVKKRIIAHWHTKKDFDRLIFGMENTSILSIESFGALDTTRIFFKEIKSFFDINTQEYKAISKFKSIYKLNRIDGGINGEENSIIRKLEILGSAQKRKM